MSKHWQRESRDDITVLTLDVQGQTANVLSSDVLAEFEQELDAIAQTSVAGIIIRSGKPGAFILGADVTRFGSIENAAEATELAANGQRIFNKLEALGCATVAVIHGFCLGGGTELALACRYRVMREDAGTRIGLPEVRLGINPGFGGTVRLPRLVGALAALDLMLTGRNVTGRAARRMGLADEVVPERHLLNAAEALIRKRPRRALARWKRIPGLPLLRPVVRQFMEKQLRKKARPDHYPAPYRILDLWQGAAGYGKEAASLGELLTGDTSRNLVRVFLLSEQLKRQGRTAPHDIKHVHVIGAGVMGGDIAAWVAHKGFTVSLQDRSPEALGRAIKRAHGFYKKKYKGNAREIEAAMDRLMPDLRSDGLAQSDLVIEAIIENEKAKQGLFAEVEQAVRDEVLLASNTSSIPLEIIGKALKNPSRLVGLHFFNPVAKMQLVEIVRGKHSSEEALARARAFTAAIERLPLDVKSSPGFLVNRILMPYLIEAIVLHEDGIELATIDEAAVAFGMPMGPIHLADTVGLDICLSVAQELSKPLGITVPDKLKQMVEAGKLGRKSGEGFYRYDARGQPQRSPAGMVGDVVTDRLVLRLLNEAVACLREGVVSDADAVDAGMVYGTGFAPFRGGPLHYAQQQGASTLSHKLYQLAEQYGERFKPDAGWSRKD